MILIKNNRKTLDIQKVLEKELLSLRLKTGLDLGLEVLWVPDKSNKKSEEIKGNVIFVYEEDFERAVKTLKHEFLEYLLNKYSSLHKRVINKLLKLIEENTV